MSIKVEISRYKHMICKDTICKTRYQYLVSGIFAIIQWLLLYKAMLLGRTVRVSLYFSIQPALNGKTHHLCCVLEF